MIIGDELVDLWVAHRLKLEAVMREAGERLGIPDHEITKMIEIALPRFAEQFVKDHKH